MIRKVGYLIDELFLDHDTGPGHPEKSERLRTISRALSEYKYKDELIRVQPREATVEELLLVHTEGLIDRIKRTVGKHRQYLDADTVTSEGSYEAACLAVGSVLELVHSIQIGHINSAFAFLRPPGHHAEPNRAMGFCLFNNVAIGAAYALKKLSLNRILIIDFDVHHGNGTQVAFYRDPRVLYISTHQFPLYPGTGSFDEVGEGPGKGYSLNFPLPAGTGDEDYNKIYEAVIYPIAEQYAPELVLVSAGFDAYFADPLADMRLTKTGFGGIARTIQNIADRCAHGKVLFVLEGGYNLDGLAECSMAVFDQMLQKDATPVHWSGGEVFNSMARTIKKRYQPFWKLSL